MDYYSFNIGKPYNNAWWHRNLQLGIITTGFDGQPGDRGEVLLRQFREDDWVIAYANGYGFVGAGKVGLRSSYQLLQPTELPSGWESKHRHCLAVNWVYAVSDLTAGIKAETVKRQAPRQTKEFLPEDVGKHLVKLLAKRSQITASYEALERFNKAFSERVEQATRDQQAVRQERLRNAPTLPKKVPVLAYAFVRNPDVVAETLFLAEGRCGRCKKPAPFTRRSDHSPYLEVHHKMPLADGGHDTVANAIALCPNCHRELHHGVDAAP